VVTRTHGEILRTEPTETHRSGDGSVLPAVTTEGVEFDWNSWVNGWLDNERAAMIPWFEKQLEKFGDELLDLFEPQLKKIGELELRLAKLDGAVDVLRGKGAPGSLNVLRQEMLDSVGDALGMVRADFEDKLALQAKGTSELELKLAEVVGSINVPRGKGAPGSFNVRGTFDTDAVYSYLDVVAFNGSSWVAVRDNPGDLPGPGWQLLSSAGKRGPRGEPGPPGAPGKEGRFPQARVWRDQVHYAGDVIVYEGSTYQAVNDTGKPPTFANDWTLLAVAGHDGRSLRPIIDGEVSPLDQAALVETSSHDGNERRIGGRRTAAEEADHRHRRLLRPRGERPRRRSAESQDELAASHSITSSARPMSGSGTVRPSALAVLRLMISSTFVD
jgi:hypothetical protein